MTPTHHLFPRLLRTSILSAVWLLVPVNLSFATEITVPGDYATIQGAIDAASEGDEIIVSPGTYYENINFNGKNIILRSTDPSDPSAVATTIIDGAKKGPVVTFAGTEVPSCALRGLTLRHGKSYDGGGICGNETRATIEYNRIVRNRAIFGGGLCYCHGTIRNNVICGNWGGYGGGLGYCDGDILNNLISGNVHSGLMACHGSVQNNIICGNSNGRWQGGGICSCDGVVRGNVIFGNEAPNGGGLAGCYATIENNVIAGNQSYYPGGGLYYCGPTFLNNTIWGNVVTGGSATGYQGEGAGLSSVYGSIANCVIWGNTTPHYPASQMWQCATPSYSCIEGIVVVPSTGNISSDPQMVDPNWGDFHLPPISPCIDAGGAVAVTEDFEGDPRPFDGASEPRGDGSDYDIGADEYYLPARPTPTPIPYISGRLPITADVNGDGFCDIVQTMEDGKLGVVLSNGSSFEPIVWGGWAGIRYTPEIGEFPLCGDLAATGHDDLILIKPWGYAYVTWPDPAVQGYFNIAVYWGAPYVLFARGEVHRTRYWLPLIGDLGGAPYPGWKSLIVVTEFGETWVSPYDDKDGFSAATPYGSPSVVYAEGEASVDRYWLPLIGDVDGDGDDDLIQITEYGEAWVALCEGGIFQTAQRWGDPGEPGILLAHGSTYPTRYWLPLAGDINGDNTTDLVQVTEYGTVWISLSLGTSFERAHYAGNPGFVCDPSIGWLPLIGDVNGDGCCDLIQVTCTTPPGDIWVSLGPNFDSAVKWRSNSDLCYLDTSGFPPPPQYRLNH